MRCCTRCCFRVSFASNPSRAGESTQLVQLDVFKVDFAPQNYALP
jgi:hypothetical protein